MKTKIQLVSMAFDELRINGITSNADSEDNVLALQSLEQLMSELLIDIGWRFEDEPDPNAISGIPQYAESAIYMALAVRIAPRYGKDAGMIRMQASSAMSALVARVNKPRQVSYPTRMPMGLGNRRQYPYSQQFMPTPDIAPNSINTEVFSIGDSRPIVLDFTDFLLPEESISSYTLNTTGGLVVTNDEPVGATILLTVTARDFGYQLIMITANGDADTVVNRRIDFQVSEPSAIRGNP